ncbi:D-alanine--D-alanine ligase family protein [Endozoicomonadaceae bacterium StTr2]
MQPSSQLSGFDYKPTQSATIAIVCGGPSSEAEVSRSSAKQVAEALAPHYQKVELVELDKDLPAKLVALRADVVFPCLHGSPGEDGTIQGMLDIMQIPYVGSGVKASACAMDKAVTKHILRPAGVPLAKELVLEQEEPVSESVARIQSELGDHVVIKPLGQGSARGVSFCKGADEIRKGIELAYQYENRLMIESFVVGKEITAGVIEGKNGPEVLPVLEIRTPEGSWYDFEHRYTPGLSEHIVPAPLPEQQYKKIQEITLIAHQLLGCEDLSRSDFVVPEEGDPIFVEINTIPGMTPTSLLPDEAKAVGISFEQLMIGFIERALKRG